MKIPYFFILFFFAIPCLHAQNRQQLFSPDGKLKVTVEIGKKITWQIESGTEILLAPSPVSMTFTDGESWGVTPRLQKTERRSHDNIITAPLYKKNQVADRYNELTLKFKKNWALVFRAYDDGIAYRFRNLNDKPLFVASEEAVFNFDKDYPTIVPYVNARQTGGSFENQFFSSFENTYTHSALSGLDEKKLIFLPLVVEAGNGKKILITEADLESYPGMYLHKNTGETGLTSIFAPYPKTTVQGGHNKLQQLVTAREPYIAKVNGKRDFPWRVVVISENDAQLADCDMVYKLASPCRIGDITWIKPGKVAWEWWNNWNIDGVDFKAGINNETYKYYIDFASANGIEYVILDEGWAVKGQADLLQVVPEIDVRELTNYATDRNVGIILWAGYEAFRKDMEKVCRYYSDLGIKGFKVDFMDRDDQEIVDFVYKAAETAAHYGLILDLHGMYKPTGLQRTYPNVLNNEGVFGLENAKWSPASTDLVTYEVTVPFIRMAAGPMDYTQGAMKNAAKGAYAPIYSEPMSQGTRCRQLAEYIIFESPLNMLCDNPSNYIREQECLRFIASVPVIWDESRALEGKIGEKIVIARRKGNTWYIGGLTDWTPRTVCLDLGFLDQHSYRAVLFRDGINADRSGRDYKREQFILDPAGEFSVGMAPGGGFALILEPVSE